MARSLASELAWRWDQVLVSLPWLPPQVSSDWLQHSRPVAITDDTLFVGVPDDGMTEWIEEFVLGPERNILERYFPGLTVRLVPFPDGADGAKPEAEWGRVVTGEPGDYCWDWDYGQIEADAVWDPLLGELDRSVSDQSALAGYALHFWTELLGPAAFLTWQAIRHLYVDRALPRWLPVVAVSIDHLARLAARGNRQAITGVWRVCRAASMVERGEPCAECFERDGQVVDAVNHVCRFRKPGTLDRLQAEGVAAVVRKGEGRHTVYRVRVFSLLPLLTAEQVARLHRVSQEKHGEWLKWHAVNPARWERLTVRHLSLPPIE